MPRLFRICCALLVWQFARVAGAEVAVLANRTVSTISVAIRRAHELPENIRIPSGDSQPIFFQGSLQVSFGELHDLQKYELKPGSAYFFARDPESKKLLLEQIGLGEQPTKPKPAEQPKFEAVKGPVTIKVKLLVDDDEATHRKIWEKKIRDRVAQASKILARHSGVRLQVVEVATWDSDDQQRDFRQTLREFEREVKPQPAQLAIGFSSQYQAVPGRTNLGVTRKPMHSHILLRERSRNLLEVERLELLVHELGHYLGASHSPEPQSVMRPLLTRGPQRRVGARIQFDPVNALVIALVGEDMREHEITDVRNLSKPTIARLRQIYGVLSQAMPADPAARQYLRILDSITANPTLVKNTRQRAAPLERETRKVLQRLVEVAERQQIDTDEPKLSGDELTNRYVREAALTAGKLNSANARRAMLLALGIFLDDTDTLRSFPGASEFISRVENDEQHAHRTEVLGKPTIRERNDFTKHFFVSALLVVTSGKDVAVSVGFAKELKDSQGGSGFSFQDMAANRAGIAFAENLLADQLTLGDVARGFHVDDYFPSVRGLEEGLTAVDLNMRYGGPEQAKLQDELDEIEQRVLNLPIYDQLKN